MKDTLGHQLRNSPKINSLLDQLVEEVMSFSRRIEGIKDADTALEAQAKADIATLGTVRSRPLYYNYLGTGVGRGPYVELADGSVKLDLINGIGIHLLGHAHPRVVRATLAGALSDVVQQGNLQPNLEYLQYSAMLLRLAQKNSRFKYAWLATCGTMANENALKMARQKKTGTRMMMTFKNALAGRSRLRTEITHKAAFKV